MASKLEFSVQKINVHFHKIALYDQKDEMILEIDFQSKRLHRKGRKF